MTVSLIKQSRLATIPKPDKSIQFSNGPVIGCLVLAEMDYVFEYCTCPVLGSLLYYALSNLNRDLINNGYLCLIFEKNYLPKMGCGSTVFVSFFIGIICWF
jgi:hypothetical protein